MLAVEVCHCVVPCEGCEMWEVCGCVGSRDVSFV